MRIRRLLAAGATALVLTGLPALAQGGSEDEANALVQKGWNSLTKGNVSKAQTFYKKAYDMYPNDITLGYVAATTFWIAQGGTVNMSDAGYSYTPSPRPRDPRLMLSTCAPLQKAAAGGSVMAKWILDLNWRDCRDKGSRLYVADDGVIRIRGTASGGGGLRQGGFIF